MSSKLPKVVRRRNATLPKKKTIVPHLKKKRFIEAWVANRGNISDSAKTAEINPSTFYSWIKNDSDFVREMLEAEQGINDYVRGKLLTKIDQGNVQSILFYLKKRHPDFQDKSQVQIKKADFNVSFILDDSLDKTPESISGLQQQIEEAEELHDQAVEPTKK